MPIVMIVLGVALLMMAVEAAAPGRRWPKVAGWWRRVLVFNCVQIAMVWVSGAVWNGWMINHRKWSADWLGVTGGAIVGYLAITFASYWWHRLRHESPFFWRWFHQLHHSPQRIEVLTTSYKHPFEVLANGVFFSAVLYLLVGLGSDAAAQAVLITGVVELFYHCNVKTPHWLGFIVQRPESHCVHHQEGLHHYNFADLPVWDMLFGTFRNPRRWQARCGFGDNEHSVLSMLCGIDVDVKT